MKVVILLLLSLVLSAFCSTPTCAQGGCSRINKTAPAQSLSYERLETDGDASSPEKVVLRLRNNTSCDITLLSFEGSPRALELIRSPDGKLSRIRIAGPDDYPDGANLDIKYDIRYLEPLPRPKKRVFIDESYVHFKLRAGRSILFRVPLNQFDFLLAIEVPFWFDWDSGAYVPSHDAVFSNYYLPEAVLRKTKSCKKISSCNSSLSMNSP
jgi:hypothetical protein